MRLFQTVLQLWSSRIWVMAWPCWVTWCHQPCGRWICDVLLQLLKRWFFKTRL